MPIQIIVPEGVLSADAEAEAFKKLTDLLLRLHGLSGNKFMTPNVIGEVTVVPKGRTFSGGASRLPRLKKFSRFPDGHITDCIAPLV
jgi:hypothetical protein